MMLANIVSSVPWFVSLFLPPVYREICWWVSIIVDELAFIGTIVVLRRVLPETTSRFALNIEHHTERFFCLTQTRTADFDCSWRSRCWVSVHIDVSFNLALVWCNSAWRRHRPLFPLDLL